MGRGQRSAIYGVLVVLLLATAGVVIGLLLVDDESVVPAFPDPRPLPNSTELTRFEREVYAFLSDRVYATADGWGHDKGLRVRDTGPWIAHTYYGTHPAVRVFYSPEVIDWIEGGRRGDLPEGAMIVKEMMTPPAARYADWPAERIDELCRLGRIDTDFGTLQCFWTAMIRDPEVSRDGWFWVSYERPPADEPDAGIDFPGDAAFASSAYPASGYGQYCTRCHSSAEDEMTFTSPRNIEGMPGEPIRFRVDDSWRTPPFPTVATPTHPGERKEDPDTTAEKTALRRAFEMAFPQQTALGPDEVSRLPEVDWDWVLPGAGEPTQFATSSQCISCHDGQGPPFGPNMFVPAGDDHAALNLSPYGEWRWSMMGLAGRDPIFHAQLESEVALWPGQPLASAIQNLCTSCHGVMGQRQLEIDNSVSPHLGGAADFLNTTGPWFLQDLVMDTGTGDEGRYGALARDGISCMSCHQVTPTEDRELITLFSGNFDVAPPTETPEGEFVNTIFGPYEDVATRAMVDSLGMDPQHSTYVSSARLCGSCHTVRLPILDAEGNVVMEGGEPKIEFEQATYLEWANSRYGNEFGYEGNPDAMTCQGCHMQAHYEDPGSSEEIELAFRIANIQDQTYPEADEEAPVEEITVPLREYRRHTLQGINLFGLEMFSQFPDVLGVKLDDFMTGSKTDLANAIAAGERLATTKTAGVAVHARRDGDGIVATVDVENLAGHRLPSGVGFRRAFVELRVLDGAENVLWASGSPDEFGRIVGTDGPLPTEFPTVLPDGTLVYQPHHQVITEPTQVQIYEELSLSPEGHFTTNFLNREVVVKDNRLLPHGWTPEGPPGAEFTEEFAEETWPVGEVWPDRPRLPTRTGDQDFLESPGTDQVVYEIAGVPEAAKVEATLHYQAIPPAYLADRFEQATGIHGRRLYFLAANLMVKGGPIDDWTVDVATGTAAVTGG